MGWVPTVGPQSDDELRGGSDLSQLPAALPSSPSWPHGGQQVHNPPADPTQEPVPPTARPSGSQSAPREAAPPPLADTEPQPLGATPVAPAGAPPPQFEASPPERHRTTFEPPAPPSQEPPAGAPSSGIRLVSPGDPPAASAELPEHGAAAPPPGTAPAGPPETLLRRRSARKDGREVASLSCLAADGAYVVRCELQPANDVRGRLLTRGPYRFASLGEANAFLDEAKRALEYLGCHVS